MFNLKKRFQNWQRETFIVPKQNEKLRKLYLEVEKYFQKVFEKNFEPNMEMFREVRCNGNEDFIKSFSNYFAGFEIVYHFFDLKNKMCGFAEPVKPAVLMDYIAFFKDKKVNYICQKLKKYIMTKLDGTIFEVDADEVVYVSDNVVHWKNDVSELFQKIEPVYDYSTKSVEWGWTDEITIQDIQNHYIDFKTEEEKILRGVK